MKNERGVSLISLIIAILVLLLIAGAVIAIAVNKKVFTNNENDTIENNTVIENIVDERPCVSFWDKKNWGEIDVHIETEDVSINIEVKYHSSESGGDQLKKYSDNIINEWGKGKNCILLILAPVVEAVGIYKAKLDSKQINSEVKFGYLCWEDIYDRFKKLSETKVETYNCYEQIMTDDVLKFLKCRGLDSFRDFDLLKDDTLKDIVINRDEFEKFKRDNVEWEKDNEKWEKDNEKWEGKNGK